MATDQTLPEDDTLKPDASQTGGIPLGMQAGAKAGGDAVDHERERERRAAAHDGGFADRSDEIEDAATGDTSGAVTRVAGSEADAIGGSSVGDVGEPLPPEAGGNAYDDAGDTDPRPARPARENG